MKKYIVEYGMYADRREKQEYLKCKETNSLKEAEIFIAKELKKFKRTEYRIIKVVKIIS